MSFGPVHDSEYGLTSLGSPVNSTSTFGLANMTTNDLRNMYSSLTIQTSPEEAQKVIEFIRNLSNAANPYMLYEHNCTTTCVEALKILGLLPSNSNITTPKGLWNTLFSQYARNSSSNFFGLQSTPKDGVNYGFQPGYDPFQLLELLENPSTDTWDPNTNTLTCDCN
jgi:hypothetical protein